MLEKGITENESLFNWFKETCLENRKLERKNGSVVLKDTEGNEVKRWNFFRAFPCRWIGPKLVTNLGSDFAVERIEIAHEGIEVDNDSEPQENDNWFHIGKNMSEETNFIGAEESSADELEYTNIPQLNGSAEQFATNMEGLVGTPYIWGGNTPEDGGMDCSGSIIYGLNQMGNDIPDQSASDLYYNYTEPVTGNVQRGADGNITHVQTITNVNGTRVNASGGPENSIENPGIIELLDPPLPTSGEIRRLHF
ncbi:phage tail protein [uncultured Treponema sp.]|uniref:phage tail protein n=1 Tax=uncultured Treponema sp. TaxID=162155 RepID=UPI00338FEEDB